MIDPDAIPQFTGNVDQLESDIADLKGDGTAIAKTGTDTNAAFQGLSAYYQAPEAEQLFATTKPVATAGATFQDDLTRVTTALSSYATEIRPIATKLADLKTQAHTFVASVAHDKDWQYDGDKVKHDNHLRSEVDTAVAAFWDAERRCANAIEAVFGGTTFTANDGTNQSTMYGYTAKQLDGAKGLPWGDPVEQKYHWYNVGHWSWSFIKGFVVDGLWGTIKGIGGLVGFEGWDTLVNSWKGLGELGIGLASYQFLPPLGPGEKALPGWLRESRKTTVAAGKAMVAWDEWSKDPARAAGGVTFNVLAVLAGGGEADGVEAAGDAGKASMAARTVGALSKAGRFVDPMTYVGKGAGFAFGNLAKIPKVSVAFDALSKAKTVSIGRIGDHLTNLRTHLTDGSDIHIPTHDLIAGPDGTIHLPDGSRLTADGNYHLPDGTTATVPSEDLAHGPHASADVPGSHELVDAHIGPGGPTHAAGGLGDHDLHGEPGTHPTSSASGTGDRSAGPASHGDVGSDDPTGHTGGSSGGHSTAAHHAPDGHSGDGSHPSSNSSLPPDPTNGGSGHPESPGHGDGTTPGGGSVHHTGWAGAGWVTEPSDHAGQLYEEIRATPNKIDLPMISHHTGVDQGVLREVKSHLFRSQHDVPLGPGRMKRGLFEPREDIASLWLRAQSGGMSGQDLRLFKNLMAHEYVESSLMKNGLPYLHAHEHLYSPISDEPGAELYHEFPKSLHDAGAHELAPHDTNGGFRHWRALGVEPPTVELKPDLSNIDEVVKNVRQSLRAKGLNLK